MASSVRFEIRPIPGESFRGCQALAKESLPPDRSGVISFGVCFAVVITAYLLTPSTAGATTLIVSLGILREPEQLAVLMLAVALLLVQGFVINRLAGIPYPVWRPAPAS